MIAGVIRYAFYGYKMVFFWFTIWLDYFIYHNIFFLIGVESTQSKDVAPNSNVKTQVKFGHLKHKSRKRHGYVFAGFFYIFFIG